MTTESNSDTPVAVEDITCSTWREFMSIVDDLRDNRANIYRGQRNSEWTIQSSLLRQISLVHEKEAKNLSLESRESFLANLVDDYFKIVMESYQMHRANHDSSKLSLIEEALAGRHQGLLTPFIDWTRSPYVAAFFAAVEVVELALQDDNKHFAVCCLGGYNFPAELSMKVVGGPILKRYGLIVEASRFGNPRAVAQRGIATYMHPQTDIETYVRELPRDSLPKMRMMKRILMPYSIAEDALKHLHHMNVNYVTLFPDQFGIAKQANLNAYLHLEGMSGSNDPGFSELIPEEKL
jgi:hypothetical protein